MFSHKSISIALFEPEIAQNVGSIIRTSVCLDVQVHIIEPCGFVWNNYYMKRAGMDYLEISNYIKHKNLEEFLSFCRANNKLLVLATTKTDRSYTNFHFSESYIVIFGKESQGLPNYIMDGAYDRITIPMQRSKRSLNLSVACGIVVSEMIRQIRYNGAADMN